MDTTKLPDLLIFLAIIFLGVKLEVVIAKRIYKKHRFGFKRYLLLIFFPMIACAVAYYRIGSPAAYMFGITALLGLALEYKVGGAYYSVVGSRLWRYYRLNLGKNTSWLAMPMWGMAGVLFLLIARLFI